MPEMGVSRKAEILSVGALIFLVVLRLLTIPPGCGNSHDTFYHVAMADLGPSVYTADTFPQLTLSYWSVHFSDKELGFHLLLSGVRRFLAVIGQPLGPPFNVEYMFFIILLLGAFFAAGWYFRIRNIWLYTLLLTVIAPFFTTRLLVLRPHLLAVALIVFSCILFDLTGSFKRLWIPFAAGFVMAWCYSNPHFILLPAAAFGLVRMRKNWRLGVLIPLVCAAGIVAGFTLHPQFPNTFINWKIQCVDVMLISLAGNAPVNLGYELVPGNFNFFLEHIVLFSAVVFNLLLFAVYVKKVTLKKADGQACAFVIMSVICYLGIFAAVRAVEYAVPFTLLAAGVLFRELRRNNISVQYMQFITRYPLRTAVPLVLALVIWGGINYTRRASKGMESVPYYELGSWMAAGKIAPGTVIGNVNWSDFPLLFYAAPQYRYLAGIDPMFAYYKHPEKMKELELFRTGRKYFSPERLIEDTGSRYLLVSRYNSRLAADMFKLGFVAVYQGKDGNLFDLMMSAANIRRKMNAAGK